MSEATIAALADAIYDAYQDSRLLSELSNDRIYALARYAAQTIESAGTTKAIVRAWLATHGVLDGVNPWEQQLRFAEALRELHS